MWSLWPWVSTIAVTRRPPTAARIGAASCGASMTSTSSSSPTSHTLLSTSKSCPSRLKTPLTTTRSIRAPIRSPRPSEDDHRPQHVAAVHLLEGLLDVLERDGLADERVEREAALQVEVDQHREVAAGQAVAVPAGPDRAAAAEDLDGRQGDL